MKKSTSESGLESPIPLGPFSNGEVPPPPFTRKHRIADEVFRGLVDEKSRRLGISRRAFIESSCGTLAAVWAINVSSGCGSSKGSGTVVGDDASAGVDARGFSRDAGYDVPSDVSAADAAAAGRDAGYEVPKDALEDTAQADAILAADDFVFDVQVHNRVPKPPWGANVCANRDAMLCPTEWVKEIFIASDTTVACLSGFPAERANDQPSIQTRDEFRRILDMVDGKPRLLFHANVRPASGNAELDAAEADARMYPVAAWKTYPDGGRLDSAGLAEFFRRARTANVKIVCAHRGLGGTVAYDDAYSPRDVVHAAMMYPDFNFLVYHAGFDQGAGEKGPYNATNPSGIDRLIKAMAEYGIGKTGNVYAELGSTWNTVSRDPTQAAHAIGKLLLHLGPDRILWGTDSVLTGRPQAQLALFRTFQIPMSMQMMFGYPALTDETKRKILGLNAARVYGVDPAVVRRKINGDDLTRLKLTRRDDPRAVPLSPFAPHGPRTWREYLGLRRWSGETV